jgi:hypothetical protein
MTGGKLMKDDHGANSLEKGDPDNAQQIPAAIIGLWSHVSGTICSVIFGPESSTVDQQRGIGRTGPQVVTREARAVLLHRG